MEKKFLLTVTISGVINIGIGGVGSFDLPLHHIALVNFSAVDYERLSQEMILAKLKDIPKSAKGESRRKKRLSASKKRV